jgi:ATP-binding cassette subfamily B protein
VRGPCRTEWRGQDHAGRTAAEQAGALSFLQQLPRGLDAQLGRWFEDGHQLSGGQWQKVALARAFLRNAPIVVLDEPTASVDAASEAEVFGRLREIAGQATTLLIAHRFSTVRVADHIIVMDRGQVLEQGSHAELMAADGMYANLFRGGFRPLVISTSLRGRHRPNPSLAERRRFRSRMKSIRIR